MTKKLNINLVKSEIGRKKGHRKALRSLGLSKRNQTVEKFDIPIVRGMVNKVN